MQDVRALHQMLLIWAMIEHCDLALMFTSHRNAIFVSLLVYPGRTLNPDLHQTNISEMFQHFHNLLPIINLLLWNLGRENRGLLERSLCTNGDPFVSSHNPDWFKPMILICIETTGLNYLKTCISPTAGKLPTCSTLPSSTLWWLRHIGLHVRKFYATALMLLHPPLLYHVNSNIPFHHHRVISLAL